MTADLKPLSEDCNVNAPKPLPSVLRLQLYAPSLMVGVLLAGATWATTEYLRRDSLTTDRQRFAQEVKSRCDAVDAAAEKLEMFLYSIRARAGRNGELSENAWKFAIGSTGPDYNFPGLVYLGHCQFEKPWDSVLLLKHSWVKQGWPEMLLRDRDLRTNTPLWMVYVGKSASRSTISSWAELDRAPNQPPTSRRGFWMFAPLLNDDVLAPLSPPPKSIGEKDWREAEARRANFYGVVTAYVDMDSLLSHTFDAGNSLVAVEAYCSSRRLPSRLMNTKLLPEKPENSYLNAPIQMRWFGDRWLFQFYTTPFFEKQSARYRPRFAFAFGSALTLVVTTAMLFQARATQRESRAAAELRVSQAALKTLLEDQQRISRDLHDHTIQSIFGVELGLQRGVKLMQKGLHGAEDQVRECMADLQSVAKELRDFVLQLNPQSFSPRNFKEVVEALVSRARRGSDAQVTLEMQHDAGRSLDARCQVEIVYVVREALSNAVRHSHAKNILLKIREDADSQTFRAEIRDDGGGFMPGADSNHEGQGTGNMKARAGAIGGTLEIVSSPGNGTGVLLNVPLPAGKEQGIT